MCRSTMTLCPACHCYLVQLQAQQTLKYALQAQVEEKQTALAQLRDKAAASKAQVLAITQQLAAAGSDAAESVPRPAGAQQAAMDVG